METCLWVNNIMLPEILVASMTIYDPGPALQVWWLTLLAIRLDDVDSKLLQLILHIDKRLSMIKPSGEHEFSFRNPRFDPNPEWVCGGVVIDRVIQFHQYTGILIAPFLDKCYCFASKRHSSTNAPEILVISDCASFFGYMSL